MTMKELVDFYLVENLKVGMSPFRIITTKHVSHFDKRARRLHDMRAAMRIIECIARQRGVWKPEGKSDAEYWDSLTVSDMWNGIYDNIRPFLLTTTQKDGMADSTHKSKLDDQAWRTAFNKMKKAKL